MQFCGALGLVIRARLHLGSVQRPHVGHSDALGHEPIPVLTLTGARFGRAYVAAPLCPPFSPEFVGSAGLQPAWRLGMPKAGHRPALRPAGDANRTAIRTGCGWSSTPPRSVTRSAYRAGGEQCGLIGAWFIPSVISGRKTVLCDSRPVICGLI